VFRDGELVAELATGSGHDDDVPRTVATTQTVFSCTKGLVAAAILLLLERGELDLDAPVARYWAGFGVNGKEGTLVRHVVSHLAGQPGFRTPLQPEDLANDGVTEAAIAADEPFWAPGTDPSYHSITYGALCGGLVRAVTGESVGAFVQREIAGPLGLEWWIGLPAEREQDVAPLHAPPPEEEPVAIDDPADQARVMNPPVLLGPGTALWNSRLYHAAEIPAAGGVGTATALARYYACLARGGELDGVRILRPETVDVGRTEISNGKDRLGDYTCRFGVGFSLPLAEDVDVGEPDSFGHGGFGGQIAVAWPRRRAGFSFLTTALRSGPVADARSAGITTAVAAALDGA
jgi:CubicO group peptidase (beta-lactamase class C family)